MVFTHFTFFRLLHIFSDCFTFFRPPTPHSCWGFLFGLAFLLLFCLFVFFNSEADLKLIRRNRLNPTATSPSPHFPHVLQIFINYVWDKRELKHRMARPWVRQSSEKDLLHVFLKMSIQKAPQRLRYCKANFKFEKPSRIVRFRNRKIQTVREKEMVWVQVSSLLIVLSLPFLLAFYQTIIWLCGV